ncbi:MAG: HNH endonuclease [Cyanomargarita calcarea GSE-NOS-MK-12-04C]|jgi:5-methylcytosine-specific restriction endonuclease McrA|uniref:HNH endonuclease n=1 Tax=Cyanomargarita calcarea GSE-NOS-MK-12-04C TaxID=2839659 RepID=A0A951QTU3_9CYAN|nr:HNH endonuclease [Cyanomargarita calcarea GSE-NOS-MK-12-04C]
MSKSYIASALRKLVYERANSCCEYCFFPEIVTLTSHEIDHIIAEKHGGLTLAENLALSCVLCNKYKGTDLASIDTETRKIAPLYHPRQDNWNKHFRLDGAEFVPLTAIGRVTVRLLQLNRKDRIEERELLINAGMFSLPNL